jgi:hypothetical protein
MLSSHDGSRRRRAVLAAALGAGFAVVVVAVLVLSSGGRSPVANGGSAAATPPAAHAVGANVNYLYDGDFDGHGYSSSELELQLRALRATGATLARGDTLWEVTEPQPPIAGVHHYDWSFDDSVAGSLARAGLRWFPVIDYTAGWAKSAPAQLHSPPADPSTYASFAGAFAARYGVGGSFWRAHPGLTPEPISTYEIWNEPDNPQFWYPTPSAPQYADLYVAARDAIRAVEPGARVIVGGLTHVSTFLPAMLVARPNLRRHIDGVAIHPYGLDPQVVLDKVAIARATLRSLGLGTIPLYVTEFGWTTEPQSALEWVSASVRPGYISQTIAALAGGYCGVADTLIYTWVTPELDPADREDWFGIHPPAGDAGSADTSAFAAGVQAGFTPASGTSARSCPAPAPPQG